MARWLVVAFAAGVAAAWAWHATTRAPSPSARATAAAAMTPDEIVDAPGLCEAVCGSECARASRTADAPPPLRCPRRCAHDADCPAGSGCAWSRLDAAGERVRRCLAADCRTPGSVAECGPGRVCLDGGSVLRCHAAGMRRAGEPCRDDDDAPAVTCAVGLRCAGGRCVAMR
jgi:hypothetical protein